MGRSDTTKTFSGSFELGAAGDVKKAQRLWIEARDADCRVPYYFYDGGTIVKILGAECERNHTADRAILIKNWREMAQGEDQ